NLELVSLVGAKTEDKSLSLNMTEDFTIFQIKDTSNLVAVHPWTSDPIKQWPIENFVKLIKKISANNNLNVIIIGGKEEEDKSKQYFSNLKAKNIINLTGKTTLKELAALLKKCRLLISGDSGPVHLASCLGTPVIAIFRNDIPAKSSKRWGPWGENHIVIEKSNLSDITVEEVFDKIKVIFGGVTS
ncbi:MAG: glycosyltransferase family 9 protein, partial [Candidatus Omnitrophica bacterium]|nr:glycosyltransferase family 9 protein [Candidatus Omnitrophota bacterium]